MSALSELIAKHSRKGTRGMGVACSGCDWRWDATATNKTHVAIHAEHLAAEIEKLTFKRVRYERAPYGSNVGMYVGETASLSVRGDELVVTIRGAE